MPDRTEIGTAIAFLLILFAIPFLPTWVTSLLTNAFTKATVAVGLLLLLRGGLVPFGQALFFCVGGYAAALGTLWLGIRDIILLLLLAATTAGTLGWIIGWLICRYRGIFFAMLSMAFSMVLYGLLLKSQTLGSSDGLSIPRPTIFGVSTIQFGAVASIFAASCVILFAALIGAHRYMQTTLGALAPALRENQVRVEYLGYSADRVVHGEFTAAAVLAGLAGCLVGLSVGQVDPGMGFWTTSGEFVFIVILGGVGGVPAPLASALVFEVVHAVAYDVAPEFWRLILGSVLLLVIMYLPNGISSIGGILRERLRWKTILSSK
jgi:branched-chain amino acid transport system permease protein